MSDSQKFETDLIGRLIEVHSRWGDDDDYKRSARGRVRAVHQVAGHLAVWLEVEDAECKSAFRHAGVEVGDIVSCSTDGDWGTARLRIVCESPLNHDHEAAMAASVLRRAIDDVAAVRRFIDKLRVGPPEQEGARREEAWASFENYAAARNVQAGGIDSRLRLAIVDAIEYQMRQRITRRSSDAP